MEKNSRATSNELQLDTLTLVRLKNASSEAGKLESRWKRRLADWHEELLDTIVEWWDQYEEMPPEDLFDPEDLLVEHSYAVSKKAIQTANSEREEDKRLSNPKGRIPRSLKALYELYENYRRGKKVPVRQRAQAKDIQKRYFKKVQEIWRQRGKDFREGKVFDRSAARDSLEKEMPFGRAKMTVQTETTYYYNQGRKNVYDESDDITHYLFVAIRDAATTKWCKTRQHVVFKKETELFEKNCPPCHWNCRSEILPLTPYNPSHKKLIDANSKKAENRTLEPLPPGWGKR